MNLNDQILLATNVNGRWEIQEDTYKGNIPQGYQVVTPQQAQQRIQENISTIQAQAQQSLSGGNRSQYERILGQIPTYQAQLSKYANYTPPTPSGTQYVQGAQGIISKENAANYVSPEQGLKAAGGGSYPGTQNIPPAPTGTLLGANIPQGTAGAAPTPTSYTVQAGDTLGAIAGKLGVPVSQLTGYRSGNPNLIYPGETISVKGAEATSKPVTLLTSSAGQDIATDNKAKLDAIQNVVNSFSGSANTPEQKAAVQSFYSSMKAEIDAATAQGGMTADERAGKQKLQEAEDAVRTAAANADATYQSKDYTSMDYWVAKATKDNEKLQQQMSDYFAQTKALRQKLTENLSPSEKEQQLQTQVNDIKTEIQQRNLQLQKDKMAEYEGQQLNFAQGRAASLDFKESFAQQELALKQANLLAELGMEQELQQMRGQSIEQQLSYIADDFNLQQSISDKITASEEKIFEQASALQKDAKDTLITILDGLQGTNPSEMSQESLAQLATISARANIPFSLVTEALKTQYQKEQALNLAQEARLSEKSTDTDVEITPEDKRGLIGAGFTPTETAQIESDVNRYGIDKVLEGITDTTQKKAIQKAYGVTEKVSRAQLETTVTQKMAQDGLKDTYTDDELSTLARDNGFSLWFTGKAGEVEKFLASPKAKELYIDLMYQQYKDAGMAE